MSLSSGTRTPLPTVEETDREAQVGTNSYIVAIDRDYGLLGKTVQWLALLSLLAKEI